MKIQEYTPKDKEAWDEYVLNHPYGLAYHLIAWKESVEQAYNFNSLYLIAKKGNTIKGILPLIHHHLPFLKGKLISLPFCDAAGPLADSPDTEKYLLKTAVKKASERGIKEISIRSSKPFAGLNEDQIINNSKIGMILNLPDNSNILLSSFKAKLRSQIKKPLRDGLTIETSGVKLLKYFYPLFAENMHALGSPVHSKKWIESILKNYRNRAHLFIVRMPDKKPAAGGVLLCHPNRVSVPWASSRRKFNRWNPNMLLYWNFLKFSCDMGYPFFDFGRSTPQEGTFRFKKQWKAQISPLFWSDLAVKYNSWSSMESINKLSSSELGCCWRKVPPSVAQGFGPELRKFIDL
ncbi:MAG: peptidoglycan bridge formation glycyltransferase FemA/FemB family protein [Desulfobacter sp.]|nr:MAG: peptidoglycan bridge formation glycyltransferase FemA/FemB family protein [Desulfobacter sp.]